MLSACIFVFLSLSDIAIAGPLDIQPINGFDIGVLVTVTDSKTDNVLAELLMPKDRVGRGYGRIKDGVCPVDKQPHSTVLCDYAGSLGLATYAAGEGSAINVEMSFSVPEWSIRMVLTPKDDEPIMHVGDAEFMKAGEGTVATMPVHSAIGFITLDLTLDQFTRN